MIFIFFYIHEKKIKIKEILLIRFNLGLWCDSGHMGVHTLVKTLQLPQGELFN